MDEADNNKAPKVEEMAQDVYPLDDAAISLVADLKANIDVLNAQLNGALVLFVRQHKLAGDWRVAPNGKELIRQQGAPPK